MGEETMDTSGSVCGKRLIEMPDGNWRSHWTWEDLSPFVQGYVRALFATPIDGPMASSVAFLSDAAGFSDLAPEALAEILKDCEAFEDGRDFDGQLFWKQRQRGAWAAQGFPPLTITLADDGKIHLRTRDE